MTQVNKKIYVLEDDDDDFESLDQSLKKVGLKNEIIRFHDGETFLEHIKNEVYLEAKTTPLLLLDLHLPGIEGQEVLRTLKRSESWRKMPVFVLTNSDQKEEIEEAMENGANTFVTKPVDFVSLASAIQRVKGISFGIALT